MAKKSKERRRGKRQENRHERRQQQHSGGGEWDCIIVPEGLDVFKPEKGETYNIDVIPYIVGPHNKNADEGDEYFELSYPVYNELGIDEKRFIAIGELAGVRDPVAEHFALLRKQGAEWDDMKDFKPKWRQLMLIFVHEEAEKGLQFCEGAYGTFGELLDEEIQGEEEDYIDNFDDPDAGATLVVRFKAKNIGQTNPWIKAAKINFEERDDGFDANGDKKLAAEILEKAGEICLDDCLKITDYDTLKAALDGVPTEEGENEPEPEKRRGRAAKEKDDKPEDDLDYGDGKEKDPKPEKKKDKGKRKQPTAKDLGIVKGGDVDHDDHGRCTVLRIAKDGLAVTIMAEDDEVYKDVDPTDLEPVDEDDEGNAAEPPAEQESKPGKSSKSGDEKSEKPAGDDADWDDDWED